MPLFNVIVIPMLQDNFSYYTYPSDNINKGFFVDVSQPEKLNQFIDYFKLDKSSLTHILTTHKHWDHAGGNLELLQQNQNLRIFGGIEDNVQGCTNPVNNNDVINFFDEQLSIKCLHVPCHTKGHMLYYCDSGKINDQDYTCEMQDNYMIVKNLDRFIFTGDTLFIGGCGRFFEGTPEQMLLNMDLISTIPAGTKIFCGHEYTMQNLDFCNKVEGSINPNIQEWINFYKSKLQKQQHTVPSIIDDEKKYNVFLRCHDNKLQEIVMGKLGDPVGTMKALRNWKNTGSNL